MNRALELMLDKYKEINGLQKENVIKEIIQEIVLCGLSRGGFFEKAVFYGGTCLRIFHNLDRFSEDLDFALLKKEDSFDIEDYFPSIKKELLSYGLDMELFSKEKTKSDSEIQSAFVKANTRILLMTFFPNSDETRNIINNQVIKIKFEIDLNNPIGGVVINKYRLLPAPYEIKIFDESTLFSGKIHAILCRDYKNRVKGRDYYDYLFYRSKGTKINLIYLKNKLINSGHLKEDDQFDIDVTKKMLKEKFENVDFEMAKRDVSNFVNRTDSLELWNKELFISTLDDLK